MHLKPYLMTRHEHAIPPSRQTRTFADDPVDTPISGPAVGRDADGTLVFAQWPITDRRTLALAAWLRSELPRTKTAAGFRMSGFELVTTFGFAPPEPIRRRFACTLCGFDRKYPKVGGALRGIVTDAASSVRHYLPDEYAAHEAAVSSVVHTDYWLGGVPWTSGVINDKTMLPYHTDRANIPNGLSIQINIREDASGGALHFPEWNMWLANESNTVVVFRGGEALHAVTPIRLHSARACRYSIVFYAKQAIGRCGPYADEPARAAHYATHLHRKRIDPDETDDTLA